MPMYDRLAIMCRLLLCSVCHFVAWPAYIILVSAAHSFDSRHRRQGTCTSSPHQCKFTSAFRGSLAAETRGRGRICLVQVLYRPNKASTTSVSESQTEENAKSWLLGNSECFFQLHGDSQKDLCTSLGFGLTVQGTGARSQKHYYRICTAHLRSLIGLGAHRWEIWTRHRESERLKKR